MPGASTTVDLVVAEDEAGPELSTARAMADCANQPECELRTVWEGIPAVLLEVIDVEDPDEVGTTDTYIITVTNQGSATDTNVRITCELEPAMEYVSSDGPTRATSTGRTITFAPLPTLQPKQKATWRVVVRGIEPGDIRFRVTMITDELTRIVEETEATRFYE